MQRYCSLPRGNKANERYNRDTNATFLHPGVWFFILCYRDLPCLSDNFAAIPVINQILLLKRPLGFFLVQNRIGIFCLKNRILCEKSEYRNL